MKKILMLMMAFFILAPTASTDEGEKEKGKLAYNYEMTVKSGQEKQFEAALKKQVAWYTEHNDQWSWHAWQWVTGPHFGQFVFRSPGHHWADMDARSELSPKAYAHYLEVVSPHVKSISSSIEMWLEDISNWSEDYGDVPFVTVYTFHLKYGKSREFHNVLERIHKTVTTAGWPESFGWITPISGNEMPLYILVIPHKNWSDMAEPENPFWKMMEKTAGRAEADSIREGLIDCVEKQTSALAEFRRDLSYMPGE